ESLATDFLQKKNYIILDRNYRALGTEIDIIAKDGEELVFVEVKTRRNHRFGEAYEAVTEFKMRNIIQTANVYIYKHELYNTQVRFDVIEVYINEKRINHIENAFILS
ncbi:putative TIGR00252 family protein, partial [Peptoniphilus sp. oral taxon 836 str. F0141]